MPIEKVNKPEGKVLPSIPVAEEPMAPTVPVIEKQP